MAQQSLTSSELANAQRVTLTDIYAVYQNQTDVLGWIDEEPADKVNKKGLQVPIEISPNPSLSIGTGDGDAFATAQASDYDNFVVTYTNLNAGTNETLAAMINNNVETSEDVFRFQAKSDARQFAKFLNDYASRGDSLGTLATVSTNYSGGTPTLAVCNGTTDSIGISQLAVNGYYTFWDATGATQRTGTVGSSAIQLGSKSTTTATFQSNIPSDVIATDIIVPQTTVSSPGGNSVYGLPAIINASNTYYGKNRATAANNGLCSYVSSATTLTAGNLATTYASIAQRGGYFDKGATNLADQMYMVLNMANWNAYYSLSLNSGAVVSSPHVFRHTAGENPKMDVGMSTVNFTWFGAPIKVANSVRGDEIYFMNPKYVRRAVLKPVGFIADGMPASDWLQGINSSGGYTMNRLRWTDWFGNIYSPQPAMLGKLVLSALNSPSQKSVMITSA